jgi:hypothetical protein
MNYLIAYQNNQNQFQKLGFVSVTGQTRFTVKTSKEVDVWYPSNTKHSDTIKKACKWLAKESAAQWVDLEIKNIKIRVAKIS